MPVMVLLCELLRVRHCIDPAREHSVDAHLVCQ
jgi:hypothetical protein